jgi:NADPH:quinone reductase-like Zn-dependent oxidoreductase
VLSFPFVSVPFPYVLASDMPGKAAYLQGLNADEIINAQTQRFEDVVGKVDIVLNYASADLLERSYRVLKTGGRYATTYGQPPQEEAERQGIRSLGVFTQPTVDQLTQLARLFDSGKLRVFVERTFPIGEAQAALEYRQTGTTSGKVVLTI